MRTLLRTTLLSLAAILAAALLVAAQPATAPTGGTAPSQGVCATTPRHGNLYVQMTIAGVPRSAVVHVPKNARTGQPLPLVLAFHGAGGTGSFMAAYSGLQKLSDSQGFLAVFPSAARPHRRWVLAEEDAGGPADLQFVEQLLDRTEALACVDAARIYATGVSNGGGMAARMGCELSSRLAAIAPVAGGYSTLDSCRPEHQLSVLEIHGTADTVVPYKGRPPNDAGSVPGFLAQWRGFDRCPGAPTQHRFGPATEEYLWSPCAGGTQVEHLKIYGGGHAWPGASPADVAPTAPISAASAVWSFFRTHSLAP
ncbi:MAG: extracellular catalytic domain type 1 short-chain-length polyhydroxyalkanoate depolymerase [Thermoleophilaceae bacterium]